MLRWFYSLFNKPRLQVTPEEKEASAKAEQFVEAQSVNNKILGARLRANEPERFVIAVFYDDNPVAPTMPTDYKLIAISKSTKEATELKAEESERYYILSYK